MAEITKMPNLGEIAEKRLAKIGITDSEQLIEIGAKEAYIRLNIVEGDTCFSTLCALEGAIQNVRWHDLSVDKKEDLKQFFKQAHNG